MSDLVFVKRRGRNGDLQYCVPEGYEWAITDSHRRPWPSRVLSTSLARSGNSRTASSMEKPHEQSILPKTEATKSQKKLALGPWQHVKLQTRISTPRADARYHANAPFCSLVVHHEKPLSEEPKSQYLTYKPTSALMMDKQIGNRPLQEKERLLKARYATVLPVVALSKNGEWVPSATGRKTYAMLDRHSTGGWSKRCAPTLSKDQSINQRPKPSRPDGKIGDVTRCSLSKPELNSSALLLQRLYVAEEELKQAQTHIGQALMHLGFSDKQINGSASVSSQDAQNAGRSIKVAAMPNKGPSSSSCTA